MHWSVVAGGAWAVVAREVCPFGVRALRGPLGVETQIGRSWRTEPLSRVSSWKSTAARYVAGSDASSVDATRSTAGADHTLRFMQWPRCTATGAPCWPSGLGLG